MQVLIRVFIALMAVVVVAGCAPEFNPAWDEPRQVDGPLVLENATVYLDRNFEELLVLRTDAGDDGPALAVERHATGARPDNMVAAADGESLYVINRDDDTLSAFSIDDDSVERDDVPLSSPYDRITVDDEGEYLLLSNSGASEDAILQNLNEVGVVDLREGLPDAVRVLTLPVRAQTLEVMPGFEFDGQAQRLAVALAPSEVAVIDLMAEDDVDQVRSIPLTTSQADAVRNPTQVVFDEPSANSGSASLFVIDDRSSDVTQIVMSLAAGDEAPRKLEISVNQLAAGQDPGRIAVLNFDDVGKRLLALDASSPEFTLVDVRSAESATYDLPMGQPASAMEIYQARDPNNDELETRVLAYSQFSTLVAVIRPESIAVGSETPTLGQTVEGIRLDAVPSEVIVDGRDDAERAVILHPGGQDGFSVLDLQTNRPLSLTGFNPTQIVVDGRTAYGIFANTAHLVRFDLESRDYWTYPLPLAGREIYLSPDNEALLIEHDGQAGRFTVLSRDSYSADDALFYEHLFLDGILGRPAYAQ